MHHGIKGQKWGVRRYQNKDGSLTPAGRKRIRRIYSKDNRLTFDEKEMKSEKDSLVKSGVVKGSNGTDIIRKGTVMGRLSDNNDESMDRRKYAYVTKRDERPYKEMAKIGQLGAKNANDVYNYRLEALDDLKVASGEAVAKRIINKYGDKKLKMAYAEYMRLDLRNNSNKTYGLSTESDSKFANNIRKQLAEYADDKWAGEYAKAIKNDTYSRVNRLLYKNEKINSEVCNYYAKKGYDAIVDAEDYLGGFEYPIVLLDPSKSVKVKSVRKLKGKQNYTN